MKALIIFNSQKAYNYFFYDLHLIVDRVIKKGYTVEIYATQKSEDCTRYLEKNPDFDLIVLSGGDGTVHELVNGIKEWTTTPKVLYFPSGTVNDVASSLNLQHDSKSILNLFNHNKILKIDTGNFNYQRFAYVAAFGALTSTAYSASNNSKSALGSVAYIFEGLKALPQLNETISLRIIIDDDEEITGEFILGLITNSTSVAGIRRFFADNKPDDGIFNLFLLAKAPLENARVFQQILLHGINHKLILKHGIFRNFSKLEVYADNKIKWSLDGEEGPTTDAIITINKQDLHIYGK